MKKMRAKVLSSCNQCHSDDERKERDCVVFDDILFYYPPKKRRHYLSSTSIMELGSLVREFCFFSLKMSLVAITSSTFPFLTPSFLPPSTRPDSHLSRENLFLFLLLRLFSAFMTSCSAISTALQRNFLVTVSPLSTAAS